MKFTFKIGTKIKEVWPQYKTHFTNFLLLTILTFVVQFFGSQDNWILTLILNLINLLLSYVWIRSIFTFIEKKEFKPFSHEMTPSMEQYWNLLKTVILYSLCILGGLILLVIPAFYFTGRLMFSVYLSIEKNQGARKSIKESWNMTRGYGWKLFWKSFVIGLFMVIGFIAFFVGSFITYPIGTVVLVMMYREFSEFSKTKTGMVQEGQTN
jgi:uncharacterized membrane protein